MTNKNEKPKLRVENISCVIPETELLGGLFLGNSFGAENPEILKLYGIRAVLTMQEYQEVLLLLLRI